MAALDRLKYLPGWPARMQASVAAAYMGMPESLFLQQHRCLGLKDGRTMFWAKAQLDRIIMAQYDYMISAPVGDDLANQYAEWSSRRVRRPRDLFERDERF